MPIPPMSILEALGDFKQFDRLLADPDIRLLHFEASFRPSLRRFIGIRGGEGRVGQVMRPVNSHGVKTGTPGW